MYELQNKDDNRGRQYDVKPYEAQVLPPSAYVRYVDNDQVQEFHLRDYIGVLLKRKWVVLSFLLSVVVTTDILTAMMIPEYKSTVVIKIDKQGPSIVPFKGVISSPDADYYETQREILKSRTLAERVIRKLDLGKNPRFMPVENIISATLGAVIDPVKDAVVNMIPSSTGGAATGSTGARPPRKPDVPAYLSNSLIRRLEVVPVKNSELVKVSFSCQDPELSMLVTNTIADEYIGYDLDSRVDAGKEAKDFLEKQIETAKTRVESSEKLLNDYASQNEMIFIDNDKQSVLNSKLSEVSTALSAQSTERMQKEALYRQIKESGSDNPVILNNGLLQGLKSQYATLEAEYWNLSRTFTPDYPKMKNLKSQLDAIRDSIEKEKSNLIKSVESDYRASLKKESYLKSAMETQKTKLLEFQKKAVQYQTLKREVDVNKELHNSLLQKLNEIGVAALNKSTNIQIIDRA